MQFATEEIERAEWMIIAGVEWALEPVAQKQRSICNANTERKQSMRNTIPRTVPKLIPAASSAIAGLTQHAESLDLSYVTVSAMTSALCELITARNHHKQGQHDRKSKRASATAVLATARSYGQIARDILKPVLGNEYSQAWNVVGFTGSLMVPRTIDRMIPMLVALGGHLTAHNTLENAALNVTAARAQALKDDLVAKKTDVANQKSTVQQLLNARDEKAKAVEEKLRLLLKELTIALDDTDPLWLAFGFNKPGILSIPVVPAGLIAMLVGPTSVALKWNKAARAERYRIYKKVVGVDSEMVWVETREELDFTVDGLPSGKTIQLAITAVNNGGESQLSEAVSVVTP